MHLNDALRYGEPQSCAFLLTGLWILGLLKFLEQLGLVVSRDARASVAHRQLERTVAGAGLDHYLAGVRELDGIANEVEQDLRQSALVPTAGRQVGLQLGLKCELLIERQRPL